MTACNTMLSTCFLRGLTCPTHWRLDDIAQTFLVVPCQAAECPLYTMIIPTILTPECPLHTMIIPTILTTMVAILISQKMNLPLRLQCNSNFTIPTLSSATNGAPKHRDNKPPYLHLPCNSNRPGTGIESASASAM